jgi:hypothetical protein
MLNNVSFLIPWSARIVQGSQTYNFSLLFKKNQLCLYNQQLGVQSAIIQLMKSVLWNFMYYIADGCLENLAGGHSSGLANVHYLM